MNETSSATPLTTSAEGVDARKPRRRDLKNLTRRNGIWQFCRVVNGKRERESLNTRDLVLAKAKRDALLKAQTRAEVDRVLGRDTRAAASMGAIFTAYRKAPTVRANADTRERNIADLVRLVRYVRGAEFNVEAMSSTELTKQLVKDWQAKKLEAVASECGQDLAAIEAAKRALNSTLTHAQSLFSENARDDYGALYLPPNVADFLAALPVAARKQEEPTQLDDSTVSKLLTAVEGLQMADAGAWAAFQLMTWGGLRNKECAHARESWLERVPLGYRLTMKADAGFLPKGNSRAVILPADTVERMLAALPTPDPATGRRPDDHLVPAMHFTDRHEAIYRRLNAWLKEQGVVGDAGKIAYRLRKYFLAKVAEQQGVMLAQAASGHSSRHTLEDHYIGRPKMAAPVRLSV